MVPDLSRSDAAPSPHVPTSLADDSEAFSQFLTAIRRHLHRNPEIGMQEHDTAQFIHEVLERHGLDVKGPVAETGLYVDIEGERPGGHVGYRADIDALPAHDAKQVAYRSRNEGAAHLCGHDAHTASRQRARFLSTQRRRPAERCPSYDSGRHTRWYRCRLCRSRRPLPRRGTLRIDVRPRHGRLRPLRRVRPSCRKRPLGPPSRIRRHRVGRRSDCERALPARGPRHRSSECDSAYRLPLLRKPGPQRDSG